MATFSEYTRNKKKKEVEGVSFRDYTKSVLGDSFDDDIAPVKTTTKSKKDSETSDKTGKKKKSASGGLEFVKNDNVFSDGYQRGDVAKSALANTGKIATGVAKGALGLGEGVSDLLLYGASGVAKLVGADDTAEYLKKEAKVNSVQNLFAPIDKSLDKYSTFGHSLEAINEGIGQVATLGAGGMILKGVGLGSGAISAVTQGAMGASAFGSGMSEAYQGDATDEEALIYGATTGASAVITEMLFGGLGKSLNVMGFGKGLSQADDILAKKLSSKINNTLAKNLVQFGVKSGAEGFEEVIDSAVSIASKKMTYMSEEDVKTIVEDENLLENFIAGAVTSGIMQSGIIPGTRNGSLIEATKNGTDFITGYTNNEQKVIDKVTEERIAEQEADGVKLSKKEKADIEEAVKRDLDKGYIDIDTIESVLGGETYEGYKSLNEKEKALQNEIKTLENDPKAVSQRRIEEAKAELDKIQNGTERDDLKKRLSEEVKALAMSDRLAESYNEKVRKTQAFKADLTKYNEKMQTTVKKAVESGILNNSNRTHEFVDMVAKLSADKGVSFDFTDNENLKKSGFALDGKTINGLVKGNEVILNVDSHKALNTVVGHEVTHVLEGTELYAELQKAVKAYAETKGEYETRLQSITALYEGVKGANIEAEITADLVGDYLFTDSDFISRLSVENRNIFQKIYDEIKYLCKVATAGSKEAKELEKVKRAFEKAYKESGTNTKNAKNTIAESDAKENVKVMDGGSVAKYSLSTWTPETQTKVRDNLVKAGYEADRVDKWIADTNSIASVIASDKDRLDFEAADNQTMLKNNQEYVKTLDASTLCAKRLLYQGTFDAIQHRMPNTVLSSDDLISLLNMMKEHGHETPCGVCYVESRRRHLGKFADEWLSGYDGEYKPSLDEVTTSDGLEALRKSHPQTYNDFITAMNKKGSSNPKVVQLRTEYRNEIMSLTPAQIKKIEAIGGLRVQSFSDFETPHLLDMMQAVMDMSAKGLSSQAYTKVPNFAWVFGDTGIKINLSLIADGDGFDADGNLAFSSVEGMDFNEAMALRDAYSDNVGTIIVGANDKHILACMADDRIDYIIPFHRSGWGSKELEMMGMSSYKDYTYGQNEHSLETGKNVPNLYPPDYWDYTISGKENAERYLNLCAQTGREPKFSNFLVDNGDGSYSLQPDGSTDGYWKTLIDFKMYNNEGQGAAQQKVQPNFNMDEAYRVLNEYEGGANKLPVAKDIVEKFVSKFNNGTLGTDTDADVRYSLSEDIEGNKLSDKQQEYFKNAKTRDESGRLKPYYHGTGRADRVGTVFRSDRATSGPMAFFTDSKAIADNYAKDKQDTSIAYDEMYDSYYTQFRIEVNGENLSVTDAWNKLPASKKAEIKSKAQHVTMDDDYENVIYDENQNRGLGGFDNYRINEHKGNYLSALVGEWLEDGNIYGDEEKFLDVLSLVGLDNVQYMNPDARNEKTYQVYLNVTNPFSTTDISDEMLQAFKDAANKADYAPGNAADMWDKRNIEPMAWIDKLERDIANGTTHAWTSIPDFITDTLKDHGYDGIFDEGGKGGGAGHQVVIPFYSEQIKDVTNENPTDNPDIHMSLGGRNKPQGNYNVYGSEIKLGESEIAPTTQTGSEKTQGTKIEDYAPINEEEIEDRHIPGEDLTRKNADRIRTIQAEIQGHQLTKDIAQKEFDDKIAQKQSEWEALQRKDTKKATELRNQITRLEARRDNLLKMIDRKIERAYKRIETIENESRFEKRKSKQKQYRELFGNLIGDTSTWKDKKMGIQYQTNTFRRNLRDIVRDAGGNHDIARADAIYDELQGSVNRNEAKKNREANILKKQFRDMKINSKETEYIQMLGELRHNPDTTLTQDVVDAYYQKNKGKIDVQKVDKAIEEARKLYDSLYDRVNAKLSEHGFKEIEYRRGYFPHINDPKQNWLSKLLNWKVQNDEIPTDIAGLTELFEPQRTWQSFDKHRTSDTTDYNFLKGLDNYVNGALDWIYHIEDIQKHRAFETEIRYRHSSEAVQKKIDEYRNNPMLSAEEVDTLIQNVLREAKNPLNNFVTDLHTRTNILAGKKSSKDRNMESDFNRHAYSIMTNVTNRVTANQVAGSVSSALTNFIPITQSWGQVNPKSSLVGMKETIQSYMSDDGVIAKSDFLTNRLAQNEALYKDAWDKIGDKVGGLMEIVDNFTSQTVWRSKYHENIKNGMTEAQAIKDADQFAENVIGGRSKGNQPTIFHAKNPVTKMLTAFQLEVSNQYGYMFKDMPQDIGKKALGKLTKGYATMFLGAYAYNALYSSLTGRDAAFDPIGIIEEFIRDLGGDDDEEENVAGAIGNLASNIADEIPYVGGLLGGGRIPISSALPYNASIPDAYTDIVEGDWKSVMDELSKPLYYGLMPMGGGQIRKTVQGLSMFSDEHPVSGSYTKSGNLRFPVEDTFLNKLQAGVFGQYASSNAREYFDRGEAPLREKQIQEYADLDLPISEYWDYRKGLKKQETLEDKFEYVADQKVSANQKNIMINNIVDRKEKVDMTNYDDFANYEEFDFYSKNTEKYNFLKDNGVSYTEYKADEKTKEMYDADYSWYKNNPEKVTVSKAISDNVIQYREYTRALNDIKADKNAEGESISGSAKEKKAAYINGLDLDYGQKIILFRTYYDSKSDKAEYNRDIVEYLDSRNDLSYEEIVTILEELDFKVYDDGTVEW